MSVSLFLLSLSRIKILGKYGRKHGVYLGRNIFQWKPLNVGFLALLVFQALMPFFFLFFFSFLNLLNKTPQVGLSCPCNPTLRPVCLT